MPPTTITDLLTALTREPGRPRVTWYGDGGERVELSGSVLENWVNKTTNLLVEEFDAGPGTRVLLDVPGHWRTVVWALAVWRVGGCVTLGRSADVVVTSSPHEHRTDSAPVVAVALPALARTFGDGLPPGAVDAAAAVMTYGDAVGWAPATAPDAPALDDGGTLAHRELLETSETEASDELLPGRRTLRPARAQLDRAWLLDALADLRAGGSVVLVSPGQADRLRSDDAARQRLVDQERVTVDLLG